MSATLNKRAACDRCHRLKMRCISDSPGPQQQCNRCRGAGTPCHYSVPGKPGRPQSQSQSARVVARGATGTARTKPQAVCTSSNLESPAVDIERAHFDYSVLTSTESYPSLASGTTDWAALGFGGHGQQQNEMDRSSNDGNIWDSDYSNDHFTSITHIKESILPSTGKTSTVGHLPAAAGCAHFGDSTQYLQQLSEFNTRLCLQTKLEPSMTVDQIELAVAQILEASTLFLELVNGADGSSKNTSSRNEQPTCYISPSRTLSVDLHDDQPDDEQDQEEEREAGGDSCRQGFPPDTAVLLQLVVMSIRITEMHYCLYSAILDHLRRNEAGANTSSTNTYTHMAPALVRPSIFIVGVALTPQPMFHLQLILQICAHYLGNIRTALHKVDGLCNTKPRIIPNTQEPATGSELVRMVMIQDQQMWTHKICAVLAKFRDEHGIAVQF